MYSNNCKIQIIDDPKGNGRKVEIFKTLLNYCLPYKITGQVRRIERTIMQNYLKKVSAYEYRKKN